MTRELLAGINYFSSLSIALSTLSLLGVLTSTLRDPLKSGMDGPSTSRIRGDLSEDKSHNASKK